jgi:DNA mismatch endonuclease (patch repair protein)
MSRIRSRNNKTTELRLRRALVAAAISGWHAHPKDVLGRPDIYFDQFRTAVFVDGCFWHGCESCGHVPKTNAAFWVAKIQYNLRRDRIVSRLLRQEGVTVVRFWEHDVLHNLKKCVQTLQTQLRQTQRHRR